MPWPPALIGDVVAAIAAVAVCAWMFCLRSPVGPTFR